MSQKIQTEFQSCKRGDMFYLPKDIYIGGALSKYQEFCDAEVEIFRRFVTPESIVVEVGANIGSHTLPLADLAKQVIAFEPQWFLSKLLKANLAINDHQNVVVHQQAVGAEPGKIMLPNIDYNAQSNFGALSLPDWQKAPQDRTYEVDMTTLDKVMADAERLDFVKLDCEGMEKDVLLGAKETIKRHKPILYVENDKLDKAQELINTIYSLDYRAYWAITSAFNPQNWAEQEENIYPNSVNIMVLCAPKDSLFEFRMGECTPETVMDVFCGTVDNKVAIDLGKTQYKEKI